MSYKQNIEKAKEVLHQTAFANKYVMKTPPPYVGVKEHGSHSVNLVCQVWCEGKDYWDTFYSMQESVKNAFDNNGIEIPFEQLDVHIKER